MSLVSHPARPWTAALAALWLTTSALAQPAGVSAAYAFVIHDPADERVDCRLLLSGLNGPTALTLPERIAFSRLDEPRLDGDVQLLGAGSLEREAPHRWRLEPEGDTAELAWSVPLDHRRQPAAARSAYEFPYLAADHGLLVTGALALAPTELELAGVRVRVELPDGWPLLAPWPETEPGVFAPASWEQLQNDLLAAGHWDVEHTEAAGVQVAAAFAPGQDALRAQVGPAIAAVVARELELFGRVPEPRYLFLFGQPDAGGYGGSVKHTSMTLFVDPALPADFAAEGVVHLVAHEYHHTWYFGSAQPFDAEELHFVVEGFTDWYAQRVPWELGLFDDAALLRRVEEALVRYDHATAAGGRSLVAAGGPDFFTDGDAYAAVYGGGLALALLCELACARADRGGDLDAIMRALHDGPRTDERPVPGLDELQALLTPAAGADFAARLAAWARQPEPVDLPGAFAAVGARLERRERAPDLAALQANVHGTTLGGIDPLDPAARIGLQPGDVLREVNGRAVAGERELRDAWATPVDGRIRVAFERDGERQELDVPVPPTVDYWLDPEVLDVLRR